MMPGSDTNLENDVHDTTLNNVFNIFSEMELKFVDHRFIVSTDTSAIEIDRSTANVRACNDSENLNVPKLKIFGIIGIIELIRGPYLIVITDREEIGCIEGHQIFKVKSTRILPFKDFVNPTEKELQDEKTYLEMIESVLSLPFYFSYTYDITNTLQRTYSMGEESLSQPIYKRADTRFFWNRHMLQKFLEVEDDISKFILPIMMGHIGIYDMDIDKNKVQFSIISRRNIHRPGTRYQIRGIDEHGNVANNVETEHILIFNDKKSAFVQIRGSIPTFWSQYPTLKYAPKIVVSKDDRRNLAAFKAHFQELHNIYKGNIVCANLADQRGREKEIVSKYRELADASGLEYLKYYPFDFHSECKGMKYENIARLLEAVQEEVDKMGWFDDSGKIQKGTLRSNCIDNLDRTNVVQSVFSKYILKKQLESFGVDDVLGIFKKMEKTINHAWADNADALSNQYASAPAMKTDYTRNGVRTKFGAFMDGVYSVQRYINNNFYDGVKTDSFNLFLGNFKVNNEQPSPLPNKKEIDKLQSLVFLLFIIVSVVLGSPLTNHWLIFFLLFGVTFGGLFFYIKNNALKLVNHPILVDDKKKKVD